MTSLTVARPFDCAPHAARSIAWSLALTMNLAIVLYALLPDTPRLAQPLPPPSLTATIVQPPPPPVEPPAVPVLRVAPHVVAAPVVAAPRPVALDLAIAPAVPTATHVDAAPTAPATDGDAGAAVADSEATIAYATATPPDYPVQALRTGVEGTVLLKVLVGPAGKPLEVVIAHGSGSRVLDDAARRHVLAAWRFHPAIRDGRPVKAWALVPVRFDLHRR